MDHVHNSIHFYLMILLYLVLCTSCKNEKNESFESYQIRKECLNSYGQCNNSYPWISYREDSIGNLLNLGWLERQKKWDLVLTRYDEVLNEINLLSDDSWLKKEFIRTYLTAKNNLQILNIDELDSLIQIESNLHKVKPNAALINYLQFKSNLLRERQEINYSYTTSLFAEYLSTQLKKNEKSYYFPFEIHAINLYRENHENEAKFFLNKALQTKSNSPGYRWLKTLWLTIGKLLSKEEIIQIKSIVSDSTQYNPYVNDLIETHLLYVCVNPEYEEELCLNELKRQTDLCEESLIINVLFLIDAYFKLGDLENAKKYLNGIKNCPIVYSEAFSWGYNYRTIRFHYLKYDKLGFKEDLLEAYKSAVNLYNSYKSRGKELINAHYADAISLINSIFIDVLFEMKQKNLISDEKIAGHLIETKLLYDKLSDTQSWVGSKIMNEDESRKVGQLKYEIEKREASCKNYLDTSLVDMGVYEELYRLHQQLYNFKKNLDTDTTNLQFNGSRFSKNKIPVNVQIIDISKTEKYYFFTSITNQDLQITRLPIEDIEKETNIFLEALRNNSKLSQKYSISKIIDELISNDQNEIFVVPDGIFHNLPIEAIIDKESLPNYNFTYASNIQKVIKNKPNIIPKEITSCSFSSIESIDDMSIKNVPELRNGLTECQSINEIYPINKLIQGKGLTEHEFLNSLNSPILHISTHSKSSSINHLDNFLYVRNEDGQGIPIYGFNIKSKTIPNSLIILSSCDSGSGSQTKGAGVFSLSRDILQAGAQTVIKSLWPVNELSTSELMVKFHSSLADGKTASQALIEAKIYVSKNPKYSHPYYWSGFIIEGNGKVTLQQ